VMEALLSADVAWSPADLADADHPGAVIRTLGAASGAEVVRLEAAEVASGVLRATPDQVSGALVEAFGGPSDEAVPVIVLNGNGVPGIGEAVAERLLPRGFRSRSRRTPRTSTTPRRSSWSARPTTSAWPNVCETCSVWGACPCRLVRVSLP
jgi:hypothetical protein